jgi:hypothetical protein
MGRHSGVGGPERQAVHVAPGSSAQRSFPRDKQRRRAGARAWGDQVVVDAGHEGGGTDVGG